MSTRITAHEWEILSAYLDGELTPAENTHLEAKLQTRPELRQALEDLRRTRSILRSQPAVRAPRNFLLTPAMVKKTPVPVRSFRLFSAMRLASALATALLMLVLVGDFLTSGLRPTLPLAAVPAFRAVEDETVLKAAPGVTTEPVEPMVGIPAPTEAPMLAQEAAPVETMMVAEASVPAQAETGAEAYPPPGEDVTAIARAPASTEEGALVTPQPAPRPTQIPPTEVVPEATESFIPPGEGAAWSGWRVLEVALAATALGAGLLAFFLRRSLLH